MSDDLRKLAEACLANASNRRPVSDDSDVCDCPSPEDTDDLARGYLALLDRVERLERAVAGVVADWQSSGDGDYVLFRLRAALEVDRA